MQKEWEAAHQGAVFDRSWFREHILPGLEPLSLGTIAKASGMSTTAASKVRSGQLVPHPSHWKALNVLALGNAGTTRDESSRKRQEN